MQQVVENLKALFQEYDCEIEPTSNNSLNIFRSKANALEVPKDVIEQLIQFYVHFYDVPCLDSLTFHSCDDSQLFEWWEDSEIWLGSRDYYILRWSADRNRFCVGDSSNVSFGKDEEFCSLSEAIMYLINVYH